jgi:hypothetical protein
MLDMHTTYSNTTPLSYSRREFDKSIDCCGISTETTLVLGSSTDDGGIGVPLVLLIAGDNKEEEEEEEKWATLLA